MSEIATDTFEALRPRLTAIAYRMLGSVGEAEDVVQDAWLRFSAHGEEIRDPTGWLVTVVTRLSIDALRSARSRRETYVGPWLPEPVVSDAPPPADAHLALAQSLTTGFLVLLETLSPLERAVYLLREAFDHRFAEIAPMVDRTEAACRQIHKRARDRIAQDRPVEEVAPPVQQALVQQFVAAVAAGDLAQATSLLAPDVVFIPDCGGRVSGARRTIHGQDHVARFVMGITRRGGGAGADVRFAWVNGQVGLVVSQGGEVTDVFGFETDGERLTALWDVRNPDKLRHLAAS